MSAPCPRCRYIHASDDARAVDRFNPAGPAGYTARNGGPLRPTRSEAEADECARRLTRDGGDDS